MDEIRTVGTVILCRQKQALAKSPRIDVHYKTVARIPFTNETEKIRFCEQNRTESLHLILNYLQNIAEKKTLDFRTAFDNWYGYYMGGLFITKYKKVQWFNRGQLKNKNLLPAIKQMHFHSEQAWKILEAQPSEHLIKDHAVPVRVLRDKLYEKCPKTIEDIERFLLAHYRLGVITKEEDNKLNDADLKDKMPPNDDSEFARYRHVGIKRYVRYDL